MISSIAIWIYITLQVFAWGFFLNVLIKKLFKFEDKNPSLVLVLLSGFAFLNTFLTLFSIFSKVGLIAHILVNLISIATILLHSGEIADYFKEIKLSFSIKNNWVFYILLLVVLYFAFQLSTFHTLNDDTNSYHALAIKYIENYAVIPGLGNVYHRLAFNNSWFTLSAFFGFSFLDVQHFNVLGNYLFLFLGIYSISGLKNIQNGNFKASNFIKIGFFPVLLFSYYFLHISYTSTPSPDIPSSLFVWILFVLLFEIFEKKLPLKFNQNLVLLQIIAFYLITIKLSSVTIILFFILILLFNLKQNKSYFLKLSLISILVLTPWIMRSYYTSGYLVYPYPSIDIFQVDWKIPEELVDKDKKEIERWAKYPSWFKKPAGKKLDDLTQDEWFEIWLENQTLPYKKLILYSAPTMLGLMLLISILKFASKKREYLFTISIYLTLIISLIFWFQTAPDLRFGWGVIFASLAISLIHLIYEINQILKFKIKPANSLVFSVLILILCLYASYIHSERIDERNKMMKIEYSDNFMFLPPDFLIPVTINYELKENNQKIYYSSPATYGLLPQAQSKGNQENAIFRTDKIEDGFKPKK